MNFGYCLKFSYIDKNSRNTSVFDQYISSTFREERDLKRKLTLQMIGYVISDYTKAKTGFFLIGASNSGKSTLLELIKRVLPEKSITTIPLYRLANRFNLARLADSRVNICTELSEQSFKALDIYKMLTSNETVTAEHKGKKPFEFRIRCKSINAGNVLPNIDNLEGMDAILNRMTILLFPNGIPDNKKDLHLCEKLWEERDSIFSEAMDELSELCKNNFIFAEPQDTKKLKAQMAVRGTAFEDFISECCTKEKGAREHFVILYEAFCEYCEENLLEVKFSKTQFSQKLVQMSGLSKSKFRLNGGKPLYGVEGICLKEAREYIGQDSEMSDIENEWQLSKSHQRKKDWNNGTLEQKEGQYE